MKTRTALEALKRLARDEEGPTAVEYAIMVGGIALVIIGAVFVLGGGLSDFFNDVPGKINSGE